MDTIILMSAGLVIAFAVGVLVGTGITTHSIDQSLRLLAQRRRLLNEREQAIESALAEHCLCLSCDRPPPGWPAPSGRGGRGAGATTNVSSRP